MRGHTPGFGNKHPAPSWWQTQDQTPQTSHSRLQTLDLKPWTLEHTVWDIGYGTCIGYCTSGHRQTLLGPSVLPCPVLRFSTGPLVR